MYGYGYGYTFGLIRSIIGSFTITFSDIQTITFSDDKTIQYEVN